MTEASRISFVWTRALALLTCMAFTPLAWAERPAVPPGHVRYIVVMRDASTIPHPADRPAPTEVEPRFEQLGARLEHSRGEVRVLTLPEPALERLRLDPAVLFVQRVWDGRPLSAPPPEPEPSRLSLNPSSDSTEQIGSDQKISWKSGDYQYDASGNIWAIGTDRHYYDHAGRIIQSTVRGQTETYSYDAFGNLVGKVTPGFASTLPAVDANTNRWKNYEYDVAGNLTTGDRDIYTYDSLNMMVKIGGTSFPPRFIYTPDDERIGIQQNDGWTRWKVRDFGGRVIREYEGDTGNSWLWVQDYIYADGHLVGGWRENARGGLINFHTDHLGSVRLITNELGWKVSAQEYWPFGQEQTPTNQEATVFAYTRPEPMKFTSHERDYLGPWQYDNIDYLDYMHAREYSPLRGRFLSVDPVISKGAMRRPQLWNRYAYVGNNPINFVDPDGRLLQLSGCAKDQSSDACKGQFNLYLSTFGKQSGDAAKYLSVGKNGIVSFKGISGGAFAKQFGMMGRASNYLISNRAATFSVFTGRTEGGANFGAQAGSGGSINVDPSAFPRMLGGVSVSATEALVHEMGHAVSTLIPGYAAGLNERAGTSLLTKMTPRNEGYATVFENAWRRAVAGETSVRTGYFEEGDVRDLGNTGVFP